MADITNTPAQVENVFAGELEILDGIAAVAIAKGQALYRVIASGDLNLADASAAGTANFRGIALNAAAIGQPVSYAKRGFLGGYDLSAQSHDDQVFLSDTEGELADAAGTVSVPVGRVHALADNDRTKCIYIDADYVNQFS